MVESMGEKMIGSGGQGSELLTCWISWINKDACEGRSTDAPADAPARKASIFARTL